jgi:hypothetical protein
MRSLAKSRLVRQPRKSNRHARRSMSRKIILLHEMYRIGRCPRRRLALLHRGLLRPRVQQPARFQRGQRMCPIHVHQMPSLRRLTTILQSRINIRVRNHPLHFHLSRPAPTTNRRMGRMSMNPHLLERSAQERRRRARRTIIARRRERTVDTVAMRRRSSVYERLIMRLTRARMWHHPLVLLNILDLLLCLIVALVHDQLFHIDARRLFILGQPSPDLTIISLTILDQAEKNAAHKTAILRPAAKRRQDQIKSTRSPMRLILDPSLSALSSQIERQRARRVYRMHITITPSPRV